MFNFAKGAVTAIHTKEKVAYLTFDDGPNPAVTPALLDLLDETGSQATFFVVGEKAAKNKSLLLEMVRRGHSIGDHSWDHRYHYFFGSEKRLGDWILRSQKSLEELGIPPIGFRSPAGVVTPRLVETLTRFGIPLIHWNRRYFDTTFAFTASKAKRAANKLMAGDILLLHDGNCRSPLTFLNSIRQLCERGKQRGYTFGALGKDKR